jgi:hypothetical protein
VASSSLKLLTVADLKLSSAPRKRVYHFVKGADESFSKKLGEHHTFVNSANHGTAIPFYKPQKNSDEHNSHSMLPFRDLEDYLKNSVSLGRKNNLCIFRLPKLLHEPHM